MARFEVVRAQTLAGLRAVDDAWLSQRATLPWFRDHATHLWVWYHVMEDELNHRGQIRWLRGRLAAHGLQATEPDGPGPGAD